MDKCLFILGKIVMLPVYSAFAIIWLGVMPALLFGMLKAVVYLILDMKP